MLAHLTKALFLSFILFFTVSAGQCIWYQFVYLRVRWSLSATPTNRVEIEATSSAQTEAAARAYIGQSKWTWIDSPKNRVHV